MKHQYGGKEKLLSFGAYPAVSLAEARLRRVKVKVVLGEGGDPGASNRPRAQMTFEEAARKWHGHRLNALDAGHVTRLLTRLERDAFPARGKLALSVITPTDVLAMVRRVEMRGALDVSRLKQHASHIYRFAIAHGWAERDPAEHLGQLLKPKPPTRHSAVADGGANRLATDHAGQARRPHKAGDVDPFAPQLPPDLAHAGSAKVLLEHTAHLWPKRIVTPSSSRPLGRLDIPGSVSMIGRWGDRQNPADRLDR